MHRPLPPAGTDQERCRHKGGGKVTNRLLFAVFCFVDIPPSFPVRLRQFIVKDSVEERMVEIQRKKQDLLEKAFGSSSGGRKTSRIEEIKALLELSDV